MRAQTHIADKKLLRRLKKGDSKAQFEVYQLYYKMLYNTALRIVQDTAEAEDVMQETFITAFDKIDTFDGGGQLGGWLRRICSNKALDALRKRHLQMEEMNESVAVMLEEEEDKTDRVAMIKAGLAQMAENHRVLVTLHLFEGYSHEEIAEQLGMSHSAVRTGYSRAKKKLQEQLAAMPLG